MIQQVNFSIDIMENGKWRIENERKDYVITLYCRAGGHHPALRLHFIFHSPFSIFHFRIVTSQFSQRKTGCSRSRFQFHKMQGMLFLVQRLQTSLIRCDNLFLYRNRCLIVALELGNKRASALRHGAQLDRVIAKLCHRALGYDLLLAAVERIHAHDAAAALVQIADNIAHVGIRDNDLERADRLEQNRICLRDTSLVGQTGRHLERQLVGVYIVVGAVEQGCTQANHRIAGQNAMLHRLADALVNCRMEVLRYGTAENLLLEQVIALGIRCKFHLNVAVLTMAAGLLLMLAFYRNSLADLLAVRNDRVGQRNLYAKLILQLGCRLKRNRRS